MHHALFCRESVDGRASRGRGPLLGDERRLFGTSTVLFGFTFRLLSLFERSRRRVAGSHALGEEEVGEVHGGGPYRRGRRRAKCNPMLASPIR